VFVSRAGLTPTQKGNIAEAAVTLAATTLGIGVLKPVQEGLRYDLIFDFHPGLDLRLSPALNNQRLGVHWAAEYAFPGAVAQLGERHTGSVEATGSSPVSSMGPHRFG
jgi:hypothetical protein